MWSHTLDSAGLRVALCDSTFDCNADFTVSAYASRDADLDEADSPAVCFAAAFLTSDAATVAATASRFILRISFLSERISARRAEITPASFAICVSNDAIFAFNWGTESCCWAQIPSAPKTAAHRHMIDAIFFIAHDLSKAPRALQIFSDVSGNKFPAKTRPAAGGFINLTNFHSEAYMFLA